MAKQPPKDDPQVLRVYKMEHWHAATSNKGLSIGGCRAWVRWACTQFGVKPPIVRSARKEGYVSNTFFRKGVIELAPMHHNLQISLHEAAHWIACKLYPAYRYDLEIHGPEWLGIYFYLLAEAHVYKPEALRAMATTYNLRYKNLRPSKFRKRL